MVDNERLATEVAAAARRIRQPFNRCRTVSHGLADALMEAGIPARVIRCSGLKPYSPNADRRWIKLGAQVYWTHYVVKVEDAVFDLTRRQFDPSADKVHTQPYAELQAEWLEVGKDWNWFEKHGLNAPEEHAADLPDDDAAQAPGSSPAP